jgi:hypothetical protein
MSGRFSNSFAKLLLKFVLILMIAIGHVRALFVLYPTGRSDVVRFLLPTLIAFCLYMVVLGRKHVLSGVLALVLTLLSFWGGMVAALNTYGS